MPEGPTIALLRDSVSIFSGKKISEAGGKGMGLDFDTLSQKTITGFSTWGKHLFVHLDSGYLDIHLMLFGSCLINEHKDMIPTLHLEIGNGELNFYASRIARRDGTPREFYDYSVDVLDPSFNLERALAKMNAQAGELICDVLLDQSIFSGVGNKLKDEILFSTRVQPQSITGMVPIRLKREMVEDAVSLSRQFLSWTRDGVLKSHLLAHTKTTCPRDNVPFVKMVLGKAKRSAYYCTQCMKLYSQLSLDLPP